eukprot:c2768_g1_i1 orf=23-172(-)
MRADKEPVEVCIVDRDVAQFAGIMMFVGVYQFQQEVCNFLAKKQQIALL